MDYKDFDRMVNEAEGNYTRSYQPSTTLPVLMRKVYTWMALALVITGITAYGVATTPSLIEAIVMNRILFWGLVIAEFGIVIGISRMLHKLSLTTATLMFIAYSVINGATLSIFLLLYTAESIGMVFFITAATFGVMAFIGYITKTDLSKIGNILYMALIGLVIATVVNLFVNSSGFQLILSYVGVIIFVGLTAYDTQKIKLMLNEQSSADESAQKLALLGALSLYLDFVNLFIYLLRILGDRR